MIADALVERFSRLDACAVSDALDSLSLPGEVTGLRRLAGEGRLVGRVVTVRLDGAVPGQIAARHLCTGAIEAAAPGDVVVVQQSTGLDAAGWGGVLSNAAKQAGLAGTIVEGPARDIDESAALGYVVFARHATARTARGRVSEVDFNGPVTVGDVAVEPGDLVVADASAVVFVAQARAEDVLRVAERIAAKETLMTEAVRAGRPISQVMGTDYESMLEPGAR